MQALRELKGSTRDRRAAARMGSRPLAWTLAGVQLLIVAEGFAFLFWSGLRAGYMFAMIAAAISVLVGALVVSVQPKNGVGWIMLLGPVPGLVSFSLDEYALLYSLHHIAVPFADLALWISRWIWTPSVGLALSMVIVRFPDGRVPRRWRFVEWLAVIGSVLLAGAMAIAFAPSSMPVIGSAGLDLTPARELMFAAGFATIGMAAVAAAASLVVRYRHGDPKLRQQTKWILLASIVVTVTLVYAAVVAIAFSKASMDVAMLPFELALGLLPLATGVAILRYRLFDIDLIISRTLMYVILTAILGGLYVGVIELVQRMFIIYTGAKSDTAIVITAFVIAAAFTPIQKWLEGLMERRFAGRDIAAALQSVSSNAESMVRIIDPHQFAHWLVDESVTKFDAEGGLLYLNEHDPYVPFHTHGHLSGDPSLEIPIHYSDHDLGRLLLGHRRGGIEYSYRDREALKRTAAALGAALVVASDFGHVANPARPERRTNHA